MADPNRIQQALAGLSGSGALRNLLNVELNYSTACDQISTVDWPGELTATLAHGPEVVAFHGEFKIIHVMLAADRLVISLERKIINRLLTASPSSMFVFANAGATCWHFVNVARDAAARHTRILRRIQVLPGDRLRIASALIAKLDVAAVPDDAPLELIRIHNAAFDVEAVTEQFFADYAAVFQRLKADLLSQAKGDSTTAHHVAHGLLNRLMFLYFVQRQCGLVKDNYEFIHRMWQRYQEGVKAGEYRAETFYTDWLAPLLNGGLFHGKASDTLGCIVSDERIGDIINCLLELHDYTIAENTPFDQTIAVAPEMLGIVGESLANTTATSDERSKAGIFYTPRIEVDFMCRRVLVEYLNRNTLVNRERIYRFTFAGWDHVDAPQFAQDELAALDAALVKLTVIDPACGSGAFLVGMGQVLLELRQVLMAQTGETLNACEERKRILEHSLYGVDVKDWAINITGLRLWLTLIEAAGAMERELPDLTTATSPSSLRFNLLVGDSLVEEIAGIFQAKGGFDVVIGNPPYVRQEYIADPNTAGPGRVATAGDKRRYKARLARVIDDSWGRNAAAISKRADLYIHFYLRGLSLLNDTGTLVFLTSSSWLDVGYGSGLQEFLLKYTRILAIYDNEVRQSFTSADVNTIIAVLEPLPTGSKPDASHLARFIMFMHPYEDAVSSTALLKVEQATERQAIIRNDRPDETLGRVFPLRQDELYRAGTAARVAEDTGSLIQADVFAQQYTGNQWGGKYLRAPEIYWTIIEKGQGKLLRLADIAQVRFGIKTGANGFFYLPSKSFDIQETTDDGLRLFPKAGIAAEQMDLGDCTRRVIFTLKDIDGLAVLSKKAGRRLFFVPAANHSDFPPGVQDYIKWGVRQGFDQSATCRSRQTWYSLAQNWSAAPFIFPSKIGERFIVYRNDRGWLEDKKLYGITPMGSAATSAQWTVALNSVVFWLLIELSARQLTGAQAIADVDVKVVGNAPVVDPVLLNAGSCEAICQQFTRRIESCFNEFGASRKDPAPVDLADINPDKADLDQIVFEALGLTEAEQALVYEAILQIVRGRLDKAESR